MNTGPAPVPVVSVCIVSRHRHRALTRCLADLASQAGSPAWELLLAADDDPDIEVAVDRAGMAAAVLHTVGLSLGANRNLLVDKARGSLLVFLDDDVRVPPGFLAAAARVARDHAGVAVFGAPNVTAADASRFDQVQGRLLATWWLTGPMARRYRPLAGARGTTGSGLTLCNLVVRSAAGPQFPEDQRGGEENAMLSDLRRRGHRMILHPDLTVAHQRRATLAGFARQLHKYGYGRGELLPASRPVPAVAALATGAGTVAVLATAARRPRAAGTAVAAAVATAGGVVGAAGWRASPDRSHRPSDLAQAVIVPVAYGLGVLHGALRRPRRAPGRRR